MPKNNYSFNSKDRAPLNGMKMETSNDMDVRNSESSGKQAGSKYKKELLTDEDRITSANCK